MEKNLQYLNGRRRPHGFGRKSGSEIELVFLHGFPFSSTMWNDQVEYFSSSYRVLTPDFRSHGKNTGNFPWTLAHLAEDLKDELDKIDAKNIVLCGLSMGGYVALEFLALYPNTVKGLILCDTAAKSDDNQDKDKRFKAMQEICRVGVEKFARDFSDKCIFENHALKSKVAGMILVNKPYDLLCGLMALAGRKDQNSTLDRISCPTLILCGEQDLITPLADSENLFKNIKKSSIVKIPKAGHLSNLENPQYFNQAIENFLEEKMISGSLPETPSVLQH